MAEYKTWLDDKAQIEKRINEGLDRHFKSNRSNWVAEIREGYYYRYGIVEIRERALFPGRTPRAWQIARYILRTEKDINKVLTGGFITWVFTRETLRRAGHKV